MDDGEADAGNDPNETGGEPAMPNRETERSGSDGSTGSAPDGATKADGSRAEDQVPGRKIRRLHEVATAMQTATSVDEIYDLTVDAGADILGFDWCGVEIATEGYFEVVAASGDVPIDVGDRPIETTHGVTGEAYMTGESNVIHDTHANPDAEPTMEVFRSGLTVPIGDRGVFQGISSEKHFFDQDDLELTELLITHTTAALDRIEETERLGELNRATRQLMTAETHEAVAEEGQKIASAVLNAPLTVVFYHNGTVLIPMTATDTAREVLDGPTPNERPAGDSDGDSVWAAMDSTEPIRRETDADGERWTLLDVPLGEQGVLRVGSPVQGAFDESTVVLAETLAANIEAAFERADRERRRREQAAQLQRQNERLERFASIVSHDLRNPLHIAATRAALAREAYGDEHIEDIENALDRMETIIEDTLALARQGRTVEETEPVSVSKVASRSWDQVETHGAGLEIVSDGVIQADPDRLQNVFENLFRNAIEHAVDGAPEELTVRIEVGPDGFAVEDTGCGIPADERELVFDLGYSSDPDGTGFGLAIVEEITESHGWDVTVAHNEAGGARFEITGVEVE